MIRISKGMGKLFAKKNWTKRLHKNEKNPREDKKKKEKVGGKTDIFLNFKSKLRHVNCQYRHDLTLQPSSNSQRAEECHS